MVSLYNIHKTISDYHKVDMDFMFQKTNRKDVVELRQIFHYLAKDLNPLMSYASIGSYGLLRDHATVMNSCKVIKDLMDVEEPLKKRVADLKLACMKCQNTAQKGNMYSFHKRKFKLISELHEAECMNDIEAVFRKIFK